MSVRMARCSLSVTAGVAVASMADVGSGGGQGSLGYPLVLGHVPGVVEHGQRIQYLADEL